jgi:hypothetical protein
MYSNGFVQGYLVSLESAVFLAAAVKVNRVGDNNLVTDCPIGFRLPSLEELELLQVQDYEVMFSEEGFNIDKRYVYISGNKIYPHVDSSDYLYWMHSALEFRDNELQLINQMIQTGVEYRTICTLVPGEYPADVLGLPVNDLVYAGQSYTLSINDPNILAVNWDFNGQTSTLQSITIIPDIIGCSFITLKRQLFNGDVISNCVPFEVIAPIGSNSEMKRQADGDLYIASESDLQMKVLSENVFEDDDYFFVPGTAPIAVKPNGELFILYSVKSSMDMMIMELDTQMNVISTVPFGRRGRLLDVVAISDTGFIAAIRGDGNNQITDGSDENHLYLIRRDKLGDTWSDTWEQTIMNNGNSCLQNRTTIYQITYYADFSYTIGPTDPTKTPQFGMECMQEPKNGRLSVSPDRVGFIFGHYNLFPGNLGNHEGDTYLSFDIETGTNMRLGWNWKVSHTLYQQQIYDGNMFLTASLGDYYPQQIGFSTINMATGQVGLYSDSIIPGIITGKPDGTSGGRLGGLVQLDSNTYACTYSRWNVTYSEHGETPNNVNELGMVVFDSSLSRLNYRTLVNSDAVNLVKTAKFGNKLLVGYIDTLRSREPGGFIPSVSGNPDWNPMYIMVVDYNAEVIVKPFRVNTFSLSANDDWETLNDGNVAWAYVTHYTNQLQLWWTRGKSGINPVQTNQAETGSAASETISNPEPMPNSMDSEPMLNTTDTPNPGVFGDVKEFKQSNTTLLRGGASSTSYSFFIIALCTLLGYISL